MKSLSHVGLSDLPGSSVHGIFQAIVLEWVAIAFSVLDTLGNANKVDLQRPTGGLSAKLAFTFLF